MNLKNCKDQTYNFNLSKEYKGIGRTLIMRRRELRENLSEEIVKEKEVCAAINKGLLAVIKKAEVKKDKKSSFQDKSADLNKNESGGNK